MQVTSSTVTLIVISIIFLVLNVPLEIYYLLLRSEQINEDSPENFAKTNLFHFTTIFLGNINNSANFLMYFVSGHKFRAAALDTVTCRWRRGWTHPCGKSTAGGRSGGGSRGMMGVTGVVQAVESYKHIYT